MCRMYTCGVELGNWVGNSAPLCYCVLATLLGTPAETSNVLVSLGDCKAIFRNITGVTSQHQASNTYINTENIEGGKG